MDSNYDRDNPPDPVEIEDSFSDWWIGLSDYLN